MSDTQQTYGIGDIANGHIWNGSQWQPLNTGAPTTGQAPQVPWYRRPWAFAIYGVAAAALVFGIAGAGGESPSPEPVSQEQQVEPEAQEVTPPVAEQPAEPAPAPTAANAPVNEKDSLAYQNAVTGAQGDIVDLREDMSDLQGDLSKGSIGWAAWNMGEIAFNVAQLQAFEPPPSMADEWAPLLEQLTAADAQLTSGYEADSVSQMQEGLNAMSSTVDQMESLLASW